MNRTIILAIFDAVMQNEALKAEIYTYRSGYLLRTG